MYLIERQFYKYVLSCAGYKMVYTPRPLKSIPNVFQAKANMLYCTYPGVLRSPTCHDLHHHLSPAPSWTSGHSSTYLVRSGSEFCFHEQRHFPAGPPCHPCRWQWCLPSGNSYCPQPPPTFLGKLRQYWSPGWLCALPPHVIFLLERRWTFWRFSTPSTCRVQLKYNKKIF